MINYYDANKNKLRLSENKFDVLYIRALEKELREDRFSILNKEIKFLKSQSVKHIMKDFGLSVIQFQNTDTKTIIENKYANFNKSENNLPSFIVF